MDGRTKYEDFKALPSDCPVGLVFMPMAKTYESIRLSVAKGLQTAGLHMNRLEEAVDDSAWQAWLIDSISEADIVVADVTGNNPFVMYELGIAHAYKIPVTLLVNSAIKSVPATVTGTPFLCYDEHNLFDFEKMFTSEIKRTINDIKNKERVSGKQVCNERDVVYLEFALILLDEINHFHNESFSPVSKTIFVDRLRVVEHRGNFRLENFSASRMFHYLLACIIEESYKIEVMILICSWIDVHKYSCCLSVSKKLLEITNIRKVIAF